MNPDDRARDRASKVTHLLRAWGSGDLEARSELLPLVYRELRRQAVGYLRHERPDHTLQPTALIHEAYIRLVGQRRVAWQNRAHFFGVAAHMMRRILVDHARAHRAVRRPAAGLRVSFDAAQGVATQPVDCEVLLLDRALAELAELDTRQAHIVELRYFAGFSEQEIADALAISRSTVTREWQSARAWMYQRLTAGRRRGTP